MITEIKNGILYFDGCNTVELAEKFGTPLYVLSETEIVNRFDQLRKCFINKYPGTRAAYASKALCTTALYKLCEREGMGIDVVSGGELYAAIKAGFPAERIEFNGNNKLPNEIEEAVDYGVGRIIVDNSQEFLRLEKICAEKGKKANILFRIAPGVAASTHDYMVTGKRDTKFGVSLDEDVIYPEVEKAIKSKYIDFLGFHIHIGSQILDNDAYLKSVDIVLEHVKEVKKRFGYTVTELNLGGGFSVTYTDEERKPFEYYLDPIIEKIRNIYQEMGEKMPAVVIEPGRSIVAEAGMSLYKIGGIKEIAGVRKYASVDGGMTDNIRPALYEAVYDGVVANKANEEKTDKVTICGKCCESGDILIKDCMITPSVAPDDIFCHFLHGSIWLFNGIKLQ